MPVRAVRSVRLALTRALCRLFFRVFSCRQKSMLNLRQTKSVFTWLIFLALNLAIYGSAPCLAQSIPPAQPDSLAADYLSDIEAAGLYRWSQTKMPIKVFFAECTSVPGYSSSLPLELANCFDEWARASKGAVSWT